MKQHLLILTLCLISAVTVKLYPQNTSRINRLLSLAQSPTNDSMKATALNQLGFEGNDFGLKGAEFAKEGMLLSSALNLKTEMAKAFLNQSYYFSQAGKYDSALLAVQKAQELNRKKDTVKHASFYARYYFTLGSITLPQGVDKDRTLQLFLRALGFAKKTGDTYLTSACYGAVGTAYNYLRQFDRSIENNTEFLDFALKSGDTLALAKAYQNLSASYLNGGNKDKFDEYSKEYEKLLPLLKSPYFNWLWVHNQALGNAEKGSLNQAIAQAIQSIEIVKKEKLDSSKLLASYYLAGYCLFLNKQYAKSNEYMLQVGRLADILKSPEYKMYAASGLAENFYALTEYKKAAEYLGIQLALSDSISSEKIKINSNYLHIKNKVDIKENQIKLQQASIKQKNVLNYVFAISTIGLLFTLAFAWLNYKNRRKIQQQRITKLETEKQLTATEAVLKGEEQERSRLAKDLHDGLGGMLSGIKHSMGNMKENLIMTPDNAAAFERSMDMLDSSIQEMRRVAHNMMPEALVKFGLDTALEDFCNHINQSRALNVSYQSLGIENNSVEQTTAITIYRIVQELLNNAIKHASANNAIVQLSKEQSKITFTVEDDGKGFDTSVLNKTRGIGWSNIQNRVEFLKGKIDVHSKAGKGTSVTVEI